MCWALPSLPPSPTRSPATQEDNLTFCFDSLHTLHSARRQTVSELEIHTRLRDHCLFNNNYPGISCRLDGYLFIPLFLYQRNVGSGSGSRTEDVTTSCLGGTTRGGNKRIRSNSGIATGSRGYPINRSERYGNLQKPSGQPVVKARLPRYRRALLIRMLVWSGRFWANYSPVFPTEIIITVHYYY